MADGSQDINAVITWTDDWSAHLAANTLTLSNATVTASDGATISGTSHTTTGVSFKLTTSGVTPTVPCDITVTVTATLSNGDTDVRRHRISVTND